MKADQIIEVESIQAKLDDWLLKFPPDRKASAVIYGLHLLQNANGGWLRTADLNWLADYLNMPPVAVYEVATFYSMYDLKPVGRHKINVCTSVSCMLNGADELAKYLKQKLKIDWDETTEDGCFTLKKVPCLAACGGAPALQIDQRYHEQMDETKLDALLESLKALG